MHKQWIRVRKLINREYIRPQTRSFAILMFVYYYISFSIWKLRLSQLLLSFTSVCHWHLLEWVLQSVSEYLPETYCCLLYGCSLDWKHSGWMISHTFTGDALGLCCADFGQGDSCGCGFRIIGTCSVGSRGKIDFQCIFWQNLVGRLC